MGGAQRADRGRWFAVCPRPAHDKGPRRRRSGPGLPCAFGPAHSKGHVCHVPWTVHTANNFQFFISILKCFLFNFCFQSLRYSDIAKVIEQFMFYFDIFIISCV